MFMTKVRKTDNLRFPVREAKNRFSELVRRAAQGEQITITLHGEPRAQLSRIQTLPRPFQVDWKWLRDMKVSDVQVPAETSIRAERDGRD
jgi:antitoxin (DNA-binding transcriptional repressor) of toxin-antitoxin stability system